MRTTINGSPENSLKGRDDAIITSLTTTQKQGGMATARLAGGKKKTRFETDFRGGEEKMKKVMLFAVHQMAVQTLAIHMFAVFSKYGTAAPLTVVVIPMGIVPLV